MAHPPQPMLSARAIPQAAVLLSISPKVNADV
jgi:hypothetical protein